MLRKKPKSSPDQNRVRQPQYGGSSKVFSYYGRTQQPDETDDNVQKKRRRGVQKSKLIHLPMIIGSALILLCIGYNLLVSTSPRIIVEGKADERLLLDAEDTYRASVVDVLQDSVFNRTKLTINTKKIDEQLTAKHPELAAVRVSLPLIGHRPLVYITPAVPFLMLDGKAGESYVLGKFGRVISEKTNRAPADTLVVQDNSGLQFALGEQALSTDNVIFIQEIFRQFTARELEVSGVELPAGSQSLHVRLKGEPFYIKFTFQGDPRTQSGAFIATYERMVRDKVKPQQYVDVRAGERVYFK